MRVMIEVARCRKAAPSPSVEENPALTSIAETRARVVAARLRQASKVRRSRLELESMRIEAITGFIRASTWGSIIAERRASGVDPASVSCD